MDTLLKHITVQGRHFLSFIICGLMLVALATVIGVPRHLSPSTERESTRLVDILKPEIDSQRNIEVLSYDAIIVGTG